MLLVLITLILFTIPKKAQAATLSISPPSGNFSIGEQFQTEIILDTQGEESAGSDIDIVYNPAQIEALSIEKGNVYDTYLGEKIDNQLGKVTLSGLVKIGSTKGYNGKGTFATINWRTKNKGNAKIKFDFISGNKNDSNVAGFSDAKDKLSAVSNGKYFVEGDKNLKSFADSMKPQKSPPRQLIYLSSGIIVLIFSLLFVILKG